MSPIPWQVDLAIFGPDWSPFHCGGTIINSNTIVTAAHCITLVPDGSTFNVNVGSTNLNSFTQVIKNYYIALTIQAMF